MATVVEDLFDIESVAVIQKCEQNTYHDRYKNEVTLCNGLDNAKYEDGYFFILSRIYL